MLILQQFTTPVKQHILTISAGIAAVGPAKFHANPFVGIALQYMVFFVLLPQTIQNRFLRL